MELIQSDEAGSIADLGLKPGGRVRMTQTSFIQIKQSINMARLEYKNIYEKNKVDFYSEIQFKHLIYHVQSMMWIIFMSQAMLYV